MAYCTVAELKAELGITDSSADTQLSLSIDAAARQVNSYCGRRTFDVDASVTVREYHPTLWSSARVDEISSTVGLIVEVDLDGDGTYETTLTLGTDFLLLPRNALVNGLAYDQILLIGNTYSFPAYYLSERASLRVTAKFGWPSVPPDVKKACLIQAAQLYKAKDTAFGVAGFGDLGVLRVQAKINPLAAALLDGYRWPSLM